MCGKGQECSSKRGFSRDLVQLSVVKIYIIALFPFLLLLFLYLFRRESANFYPWAWDGELGWRDERGSIENRNGGESSKNETLPLTFSQGRP